MYNIASTVSDQSAYTIELHWNHYICAFDLDLVLVYASTQVVHVATQRQTWPWDVGGVLLRSA